MSTFAHPTMELEALRLLIRRPLPLLLRPHRKQLLQAPFFIPKVTKRRPRRLTMPRR
jgi:hypothetical protein